MQRWLARAVATAAGGSEKTRTGWEGERQDERPQGWVKKGTKLILRRGHVSRSQSNTLSERREPESGRTVRPFGLDNRHTSRTGFWDSVERRCLGRDIDAILEFICFLRL